MPSPRHTIHPTHCQLSYRTAITVVLELCCLLGVLTSRPARADVVLTGDTSCPTMSLFIPGEPVTITFTATGLKNAKDLKLLLTVADEHDRVLARQQLPVTPDAAGKCVISYQAPHGRLGFYRVYAKLSDGVQLEKLGSRAAGYLTYAVVPNPAQRKLYPPQETHFGMQGGFSPKVNVLPYLGIRWVLGGYSWRQNEPDHAGQFAEKLAQAHQKGKSLAPDWSWCHVTAGGKTRPWTVYPLPSLFFAPKWAVQPQTASYCTGTLTAAGEKAWQEYCREVGRTVAAERPDLPQHLYQITWEPVYPWGFKGTDEQLIRIYQLAYPALHQADPKAVVLGPTGAGISEKDVRWNATLLKKGLGRYLDGYSIHPYHAIPPERAGLIEHVRALKELVRQYVGHDLPFFGTEQGWATKGDPGKELEQARGLLRENLIMLGEGFRFNFAFYIADYPGEPGFGYMYNLSKIPYGTDKMSPKPIAAAYAAQSFLLEGHHTAGPIEWLGQTTMGYAFERGQQVVLALWDYGPQPHTVKLPVGEKQVEVYDWMGNGRETAAPGGSLSLTLGPEPVYVSGVSPRLWGSGAKKPLHLAASHLTSCPGGEAEVAGTVTTPAGARARSLLLEADERLGVVPLTLKLPAAQGTPQNFRLQLPVPEDAALGNYPVKVLLREGDNMVAADGLMLTVASPVSVEDIRPALTATGGPGLEVTLHEQQQRRVRGQVQLRLQGVPDSRRQAPFDLAPGAKQTFIFDYADVAAASLSHGTRHTQRDTRGLNLLVGYAMPARRYKLIVEVITADGFHYQQETTVNLMVAPHLAAAPVIDGRLGEWGRVPRVSLDGWEWVVRNPSLYRGSDDLSANLQYAWDQRALYVAATVRDDVQLQTQTGWATWRQDCLQLAFNLDPRRAQEQTGNLLAEAGQRRRCSEIDLALGPHGPEAYRTQSFDPAKFPVAPLTKSQLQVAVTRQDSLTTYEAAIPWATLGASGPLKRGQLLGLAATVNDADAPSQADPKALGLFGGITPTKDPDQFGLLLLGSAATASSASTKPTVSPQFSGVLGQSQPLGAPPLPFIGVDGAAVDATGKLWTMAGPVLYAFSRDSKGQWRCCSKLQLPVPAIPNQGVRSDGRRLFFIGANRQLYGCTPGQEPRPIGPVGKDVRSFAVAPAGLRAGYAARGKFFFLAGDIVSAMSEDGRDRGPVLKLARPAQAKWWYCAVGIAPRTGDLLVGSYWPDCKVYRYDAAGRQITGGGWPRNAQVTEIVTVRDEAWACLAGGGALMLPLSEGNRAVAPGLPAGWTMYARGLAAAPGGGYWLATTQGLVQYDRRRRPTDRRLGGISGVRSLAVAGDGTVIASTERGQHMLRLFLDDEPEAALSGNGNEPWRVAANWTNRAADLAWDGRTFLVLDEVGKQLWRFDPWHTAWAEKPWVKVNDPGSFQDPRALAVSPGKLWVLDGGRLLESDLAAPARLQPVQLPQGLTAGQIRLLQAGGDDVLFVATTKTVIALKRDRTSRWRELWRKTMAPVALAAGKNCLVAVDSGVGCIILSPTTGEKLATIRADSVPGGMSPSAATMRGPWLLVADTAGSRILRFRLGAAGGSEAGGAR